MSMLILFFAVKLCSTISLLSVYLLSFYHDFFKHSFLVKECVSIVLNFGQAFVK